MKQDKQAGGLPESIRPPAGGFGLLVPEDGGAGGRLVHSSAPGGGRRGHGDRVLARPEDEGGRAGGAPPGLPPWWSGPKDGHRRAGPAQLGLWLRPDSDRLPSPIQVLTKRKGVRAGDRAAVAMTSFRKRQAPAHGYLCGGVRPRRGPARPWPPCCTSTRSTGNSPMP